MSLSIHITDTKGWTKSLGELVADTAQRTLLDYVDEDVHHAKLGMLIRVGGSEDLFQATVTGPKGRVLQLIVADARSILGLPFEDLAAMPSTLNEEARKTMADALGVRVARLHQYNPTLPGVATLVEKGRATHGILERELARHLGVDYVNLQSPALYGVGENVSFPKADTPRWDDPRWKDKESTFDPASLDQDTVTLGYGSSDWPWALLAAVACLGAVAVVGYAMSGTERASNQASFRPGRF